jgi:hypothetical protein
VPDFPASIDRLLIQVHHWDERRWSAGAAPTKAQLVHGLAQTLADLGAAAEQRPSREVPRLHDMVLPDQIRVLTDDLLAASPSAGLIERAAIATDEVRRSLQ